MEGDTIMGIVAEMMEKAEQADFQCCGNVDASFVRWYAQRLEAVNNRALEVSEKFKNAEAALKPVLECDPDITMPYSSVLAVAKAKMIFSKAVAGNE